MSRTLDQLKAATDRYKEIHDAARKRQLHRLAQGAPIVAKRAKTADSVPSVGVISSNDNILGSLSTNSAIGNRIIKPLPARLERRSTKRVVRFTEGSDTDTETEKAEGKVSHDSTTTINSTQRPSTSGELYPSLAGRTGSLGRPRTSGYTSSAHELSVRAAPVIFTKPISARATPQQGFCEKASPYSDGGQITGASGQILPTMKVAGAKRDRTYIDEEEEDEWLDMMKSARNATMARYISGEVPVPPEVYLWWCEMCSPAKKLRVI